MTRAHQYADVVAGNTFAPAARLELRDAVSGGHLDLTGATVTITIVDETTREVIVQDAEAEQNEVNPYLIEYFLTDDDVAKITRESTWLAQWTLTAGSGRKHLVPVICRIQVSPPLGPSL